MASLGSIVHEKQSPVEPSPAGQASPWLGFGKDCGFETPVVDGGKRVKQEGGKDRIRDSFTSLFTPSLFASPGPGGQNGLAPLPSPNFLEDDTVVPDLRRRTMGLTPQMTPGWGGISRNATPNFLSVEGERVMNEIHQDFYAQMDDRTVPNSFTTTPRLEGPNLTPLIHTPVKQTTSKPKKSIAKKTKTSTTVVKEETELAKPVKHDPRKDALMRELRKKTREAAIVRWKQKRRERLSGKHIRYTCRKKLADARPRVKGRFVKSDELEA